ncbi:MAG: ThuA domain-containing protein [Bacteroidota bacterium]
MQRITTLILSCILLTILVACSSTKEENREATTSKAAIPTQKLKALIIDGQNNHGVFPLTTILMGDYLKETGLFTVDYARTVYIWQGPHFDQEALGVKAENAAILLEKYPLPNDQKTTVVAEPRMDSTFSPDFAAYDVVVSNLGWKAADWPEQTKANFEQYMEDGGGLVVVHAANNSFGDWEAYNKMIGLGGWGGRDVNSGPYVYYNDAGERIDDPVAGPCGSHGPQQDYVMTTRSPEHPIMRGLPEKWLHVYDELYDRLRGPAENMTVLATAYSDKVKNGPPWNKEVSGTGRHEPLLMAINYGQGRVFHSGMGHMGTSMECVGFMTTFQRGAEWAATGKVTQAVPADFPTETATATRVWKGRVALGEDESVK